MLEPEWQDLPCLEARTRKVYLGKDWVYKVATNDEGFFANGIEAAHYKKGSPYIPIAECYLIDEVLKMRRVTPADILGDHMPEWTLSVDCQQVGYDHQGKLVAYDL